MQANKKSAPVPQSPPTFHRFVVVMLCAIGLAGLLSCQSSSKPSDPVVRETPPPSKTPAAPMPDMPVTVRPNVAPEISSDNVPDVRVAALKDAAGLKITTGAVEARVFNATGAEIERIPANTSIQMNFSPNALVANGSPLNELSLRFESTSSNAVLKLNDQDMAPRVTVFRQARGLLAVAQINLEEYLAGVLAGEVPYDKWHLEALKAQAIASRSFAYYQLKKNAAELYDVESTVMSQVFRAGYRSNPTIANIVNSTRGMVLTNNGAAFSAYFHSTCGDHTDPSSLIFPDRPAARPFAPVTCGFCGQSPSSRWTYSLDKRVLEQKLASNFNASQHLASVNFLDTNGAAIGADATNFRRVALVQIKRTDGSTFQIVANQFRLAVGAKDLKSMLFAQAVDRGSSIELSGAGFGHGVGLCQWGSEGMAAAGYSHLQILGKYYAGAALTRIY